MNSRSIIKSNHREHLEQVISFYNITLNTANVFCGEKVCVARNILCTKNMKTFQAAEWDVDATGDNTYQELFQKSKSRKIKEKSKFLTGKVEKARKEKVKLKKLLKQEYSDLKSKYKDTNLIDAQTNPEEYTKSKKKRMKQKRKLERNNTEQRKVEQSLGSSNQKAKKVKEKVKKSKEHIAGGVDDAENGITKKQSKMLKKYASELNSLNNRSDQLGEELLREKKRQRKLQKKLEKARKKEKLLSKVIETTIKTKFSSDKAKRANHKQKKPIEATEIIDLDSESDTTDKKRKVKRKQHVSESLDYEDKNGQPEKILEYQRKTKKKKLQEKLKIILSEVKNNKPIISLRQKMMEKLKAARFRFLNEQIYTTDSKEAQKIFKSDPEAFNAYHEGYRQQVKRWPLNPLDVIIKSIQNMPKSHTVADFGCGDAKLAKSVRQKVYSFDLVAANDSVVACDMAKVPLEDGSINVAVFCLSLMGTNLHDYLLEANRVLSIGGMLKIAEVESRFENVENFIEGVQRFGFKKTWKDLSHNLFYFLDFKKINNIKNKKKLPTISLLPCLYKKR